MAFYSSTGWAPCPNCSNTINEIGVMFGEVAPTRCEHCGIYIVGKKGEVRECDDSCITINRVFGILPARFIPSSSMEEPAWQWPSRCCVCKSPWTRMEEVSTFVGVSKGNVFDTVANISIKVPHCYEHSKGADFIDGGVLAVRSYSFYKEFRTLNNI